MEYEDFPGGLTKTFGLLFNQLFASYFDLGRGINLSFLPQAGQG